MRGPRSTCAPSPARLRRVDDGRCASACSTSRRSPRAARARTRSRTRVDLARLTDELGYSRYWVAEHHGMPMLASTAPEILIAEIAAVTERIRVGSGGVMLPHYSPFKVAETFSMLGGPARRPHRPRHRPRARARIARRCSRSSATAARCRRTTSPSSSPSCSRTSRTTSRESHPSRGWRRCPALPGRPDVWLLGSSPQSAIWAGELGLPYSVADFINPERRRERAPLPRALRAVAAPRAARDDRLRLGDLRRDATRRRSGSRRAGAWRSRCCAGAS